MCSKPIFCSNVAQKSKICSRLLELQKVAQKMPSTIGKGLSASCWRPVCRCNAMRHLPEGSLTDLTDNEL